MTTVGIRELKAHLSHYVRLARQGERVIVTDRGREVAELRAVTPVQAGLKELIDSGMVKWSGGKPTTFPRRRTLRSEPLSETIVRERG
jgi:antitoxin (DNA-binding transcriptional repressor) of toxin-antitoxin stability system